MSELKPNHICKNKFCTKGTDGGRKHYYACDYCDKTFNYRSVACSLECYEAYMKQVIEARSKNKKVDTLPDRTDMSKKETKKLLEKNTKVVLEETKEKLKDYIDDNDTTDFSSVVEKINDEIDKKKELKRTSENEISEGENKGNTRTSKKSKAK